jgi:hypothetical protein
MFFKSLNKIRTFYYQRSVRSTRHLTDRRTQWHFSLRGMHFLQVFQNRNFGYVSLFNFIVKWRFRWRICRLNIVRLPCISTQFIRYQHNALLCNSLQWWFDPIPSHGLTWWGCMITLIAHFTPVGILWTSDQLDA